MFYPNLTQRDKKNIVGLSTIYYEATTLLTYGTHTQQEILLRTIHRRGHLDLTEYVSRNLAPRKQGVETVAAAFTDHFAILLRLSLDSPYRLMGEEAGG